MSSPRGIVGVACLQAYSGERGSGVPGPLFSKERPYDCGHIGGRKHLPKRKYYTVKPLNYQLKQLCRNHREGSYGTQAQRERELTLIANQLHELGFRSMSARSLKPKHVQGLVDHWREQQVAVGTIKNRMSAIRWWSRKVNKQNVVARSNSHYGISNRVFSTTGSKAKSVCEADLAKIPDAHVRMSLRMQQAFGLRREEAMKFNPSIADKGDHLALRASWTKGGKARCIPVRTEEQRQLLDQVRLLTGRGSLIPSNRSYVQQLRIYEGQTNRAGLSKLHGLRHAYAQWRYEELTGWKSPAAGGPKSKDLSPDQKEIDKKARLIISRELGHEREQITVVYLGR